MSWRVEFPGTRFAALELPELTPLVLHLTVENSPVLFGCRSGLCGTCLIEAEPTGGGTLPQPEPLEAETLDLYAPGNPKARLACQLVLSSGVRIVKIDGL